jgi:hypothetical protein
VAVEKLRQQCGQGRPFASVEAGQGFGLRRVGVRLDLRQAPRAGSSEGDDVAATVGRVGPTIDMPLVREAGDGAADLVAVQPESASDVGLAEGAVLLQRGEDGELGAGGQRHVPGGQAGAQTGKRFNVEFAQPVRWGGDQIIEIHTSWDTAAQARQTGAA